MPKKPTSMTSHRRTMPCNTLLAAPSTPQAAPGFISSKRLFPLPARNRRHIRAGFKQIARDTLPPPQSTMPIALRMCAGIELTSGDDSKRAPPLILPAQQTVDHLMHCSVAADAAEGTRFSQSEKCGTNIAVRLPNIYPGCSADASDHHMAIIELGITCCSDYRLPYRVRWEAPPSAPKRHKAWMDGRIARGKLLRRGPGGPTWQEECLRGISYRGPVQALPCRQCELFELVPGQLTHRRRPCPVCRADSRCPRRAPCTRSARW